MTKEICKEQGWGLGVQIHKPTEISRFYYKNVVSEDKPEESNDSLEVQDRGETSDIHDLPSGLTKHKK